MCGLRVRGREGTMTGWIFRSKQCVCVLTDSPQSQQLSTEDLPAEDLIDAEPFEWLAVAGRGGMGTVYKARDRKLGRLMAVKVMQLDEEPRAADTFLREAKAASKLHHPNIVTVADYGIMKDGRQFLAIEWIDGITLADYIERHGCLSVEAAREIFIQILDGLSHAHKRNVIHRDIKPKNIMLSRTTSGAWTVKLIDFGTAKDLTQEGFQTRAEDMACSPFYVSPERVDGLIVDHRSDLYSLGCTMFESLVGHPPFRGAAMPVVMMHMNDTPPTLEEASGKSFPLYLEQTIAKLLAKSPVDRFADADATKAALEERFVDDAEQLQFLTTRLNLSENHIEEIEQRSLSPIGIAVVTVAIVGFCASAWLGFNMLFPAENTKPKHFDSGSGAESGAAGMLSGTDGENVMTRSGTDISLSAPSKADLAQLKQLTGIIHITITNCKKIPKKTFENLASQHEIQRVDFDICTDLDPIILGPLKNYPKLEHICLTDCTVKPGFISALRKLKKLRRLDLKYSNIDNEALSEVNDLPNLKLLKVVGSALKDNQVDMFATQKQIEEYDLSENNLTGDFLQNLSSRATVERLILHDNPIKEETLAHLKNYPKLTTLEYDDNILSGSAVKHFALAPKLVNLSLPRVRTKPDTYKELGKITRLVRLNLNDTQTTDSDLLDLAPLVNLNYLNLQETKVTNSGIEKVRPSFKKIQQLLTDANSHE